MRILFVAIPDSVHTARWTNQLASLDWDIHLFPSTQGDPHEDFRDITIHSLIRSPAFPPSANVRQRGLPCPTGLRRSSVRRNLQELFRRFDPARRLARLIDRIKPDIIHSLELQGAGYQTLAARRHVRGQFPTWIATNWGSDIYLFGRLNEHRDKIREVMTCCDYYSCEGIRDAKLGREFGFRGILLPILPNTGGFDLMRIQELRQPGPTSHRRLILLKGYQHWAGRALFGLRALELCRESLDGYEIAIYLPSPEVKVAAELLSQRIGIPITLIPKCSHEDMLRLHGKARISIGLSISDALSTSFLEALVMGSFPIQSDTSMADEWITNGETGLAVHPEDPDQIAQAIRMALSDDGLVDRAAKINEQTARDRLDQDKIRPQIVQMYEKIYHDTQGKKG